MPSPCDSCKDTCSDGRSNCGSQCKCGSNCDCSKGSKQCCSDKDKK
ncbi:unnamed protein product [Phyllotreta striolata]|uniref:Metallothionein n=1 Tax=Phyllotreta striolata TaxID=444603 RepID=A0A9N9XPB1_PHYSR|nr:unnamed protein product [Phyllotreta striolata]